jgi:hypothetical protein
MVLKVESLGQNASRPGPGQHAAPHPEDLWAPASSREHYDRFPRASSDSEVQERSTLVTGAALAEVHLQ